MSIARIKLLLDLTYREYRAAHRAGMTSWAESIQKRNHFLLTLLGRRNK